MACLPQELVDAIIDRIPDKTSLKQCALVAPSFLAPSQRRIFRSFRSLSVYRGQSQRRPNLAAASALLTASPHIASYVRNLLVELPNFILESPSLETVLRALRNLERLVVSGKSVAWNNLEPGARSALFHSVALPSLVRLHLVNVRDVPWALIVAATSIPVLSFYAILMDQREDPHPLIQHHESSSSPRLRHLILNDAGPSIPPICDFLLQSMTPPHTSRIERLEIRIVPFSGGYDQRLLAACASTLQYLVIDPGALIQSINIPHMPLVRGVEINIFIDRNRRLPALFPSTLSQLASSMPLLETITLAFVVEPTHPEAAWSDAGPLPILGLSFKGRMELLHLRAVHCKLLQRNTFGTPEGPDTLFSRFVDAMESRMPGLQDTGILTCTLTEPQPRYVDRLP